MNAPLPYEDDFFDYIACVEGIEHIENTHHLLREFARILKPSGKVMVTTPNVLNFKSRLRYMLRGTFFGFPHICREVKPGEHLHINPVSISALQFAARQAGFEIEKVHPFPFRRNWIYIPGALFLMAYTKVGLLMRRKDDDYSRLHALMVSKNILLGDVLIVSLKRRKTEGAG
jgi:SAM-dependent methyltransferase